MDHLTEQDAGLLEQAASMLEGLANDERNRGNCSSSEGAACSAHAIRRLAPALLRVGRGCLAQIEEPAQPVLYVSPGQLANHSNPEGPESEKAGRYLPARVTPAGKFTQPLYAGAAPAAVAPLPAVLEQIAQGWDGCKYDAPGETLDIGADIRAAAKRLRADQAQAMSEASSLAMSLFQKHYSSDPDYASGAVKFGLCDELRGVISQIDNMSTGLTRAELEARKPLPLSYRSGVMTSGVEGGATVSLHFNDMAEAEAWFVEITDQFDAHGITGGSS